MEILAIDRVNKKIEIKIPLVQPTGKIRIKERSNYTDFGAPVATKQKPFNQNMYVEWQISYDAELNSPKAKLSTLNNSSLYFKGYNKKTKILYELSEYLYYFCEMNIIKEEEINTLIDYIDKIPNRNLIENLYRIYKSNPIKKVINKISFLESELKYPHLIHDFNNGFFVITEITIREKQKAVGIQPMLYICFPVSYLLDINGNPILGRTARKKEYAIFELNSSNEFLIKECFKIFGMLSIGHKYDTLQILNLIKSHFF